MTAVHTICDSDVRQCFVPRAADSHKGTYGHVLSVCGSYGMIGASVLAATAVLRSGAGRLTAAMPRSCYPIFTPQVPEAVCLPLAECDNGTLSAKATDALLHAVQTATVLLCGPGIGRSEEQDAVILALLQKTACPIVLDADGINLLSRHIHTVKTVFAPLCLTPHPAELARLLGCTVNEVQNDRETAVMTAARDLNATVVLKGHHTLIASPNEQEILLNPTGTPGMAVGGSGDVLAGMIASFAAQGMPLRQAAMCAVYLHGAAGELAAARLSQHAMLPRDILAHLGDLFSDFE